MPLHADFRTMRCFVAAVSNLRERRSQNGWVRCKTGLMAKTKKNIVLSLCGIFCLGLPLQAQETPSPAHRAMATAPATPVSIDGSEAMFTTMCALLAAGFESDVDASKWNPYRAQMRDRLERQQGPAVDALRNYYKQHVLDDPEATLSRFIWFGLVSGPAPNFEPVLKRDQLPPDVIALEGFQEILANYYKEQKIGEMWRQVQPVYNREIAQMHDQVSQLVFVTSGYLREMLEPEDQRSFTVIVEPLVGRLTNVRNFGDHYALVLSGGGQVPTDIVRHAFLHFLLDPLPLQYPHVVANKRPLYQIAATAPQLSPDLKDDYPSFFSECLVRAVELRLKRLSPSEKEAIMQVDDSAGYVLVHPLFNALAKFEESEPSMKLFFPDLVRAIDESAEEKRVAQLHFAPAPAAAAEATESEAVAHRKFQVPATLPDDQDAIAALTEGERRIAEKNPGAAEISFKRVLAKYPDQPRARYGLGLVALLKHDSPTAKEVFGRLTAGDHAASQDPMILAWSHVYLARIYGDEGDMDKAKSEFQAALNVAGGPDRARDAAQKGLNVVDHLKQRERP